jgi:hypothetical protein
LLTSDEADAMDSRRRPVFLTAKDRSVARDIGKLMRSQRFSRTETVTMVGG